MRNKLFLIFLFMFVGINFALPIIMQKHANKKNDSCRATIGNTSYVCSLGKTGISANKQEGDGATPEGNFYLRKVFYRPDKINRHDIKTNLPVQALQKNDAWCDDVSSEKYNQEIKLPFSRSHEKLWREDDVYNLIVVVGYNDKPVKKNKGSAIFLHIAREGYTPTAGCIAFSKNDLLHILEKLGPHTILKISKQGQIEFQT